MSRLDLLVFTHLGERINVKIQVVYQYDMPERVLYYWARLFSVSLSKGQEYSELPPTIMITIFNYPLFPHETDRFHTVFHIREDEEHFLWSPHLEFHAIDLSQEPTYVFKKLKEIIFTDFLCKCLAPPEMNVESIKQKFICT
jgi:predicted transposase/invertase (TIGR01784 family)